MLLTLAFSTAVKFCAFSFAPVRDKNHQNLTPSQDNLSVLWKNPKISNIYWRGNARKRYSPSPPILLTKGCANMKPQWWWQLLKVSLKREFAFYLALVNVVKCKLIFFWSWIFENCIKFKRERKIHCCVLREVSYIVHSRTVA